MKKVKATPKNKKKHTREPLAFGVKGFTLVYRIKVCELWKETEINNEK